MRVTACVVSWNTAEHLPGALTTLLQQDHPDLRVVVIDNGSHDGSVEVAKRFDGVEVIANPDNRGFAGGANQGVALSDPGGAFMVLNPDVRLDPAHVSRLVAALHDDPRAASVQGRLWKMDAEGRPLTEGGHKLIDTTGHQAHTNRVFRNRGDGRPDDGAFDEPAEIFGVSGCAALYRVDALHDVAVDGEVYDEDYFAYFEDLDLDWRLRARGWRSRYVPDATGLHERGGDGVRRSAFVERLSFRNWFLLVLKNDSPAAMARHAHLLGATTVLRTADLALTVPTALLKAIGDDIRIAPRALRKRRAADARRTVDNQQIIDDWFIDFDYREWYARRFQRSRLGRRLGRRDYG